MIVSLESPYTRSETLWFDDGNVVLETEGVIFRTYTGILSRNSSIFQDMFALPQPPGAEVLEGLPIVHFTDSAMDLINFLKATHDASFYDIDQISDFFVIAGVLRLSTKYNVPYLRKRSIKALSSLYPSELSEFEACASSRSLRVRSFPGGHYAVVNLARECDVHIVLPAALYCCCIGRSITAPILDGIRVVGQDGESRCMLSNEDKRLCLLTRSTLENRAQNGVMAFLYGAINPATCVSRNVCNAARLTILRGMKSKNANFAGSNPLLIGFKWHMFKELVCTACCQSSEESCNRERVALWSELPTIFGLEAWPVLRAQLDSEE